MLTALLLVPFVIGALALLAPLRALRKPLMLGCAVAHLTLSVLLVADGAPPPADGLVGLDALGRVFLPLLSVLYLAAAVHSLHDAEKADPLPESRAKAAFLDFSREAVLPACFAFFLGSMTLTVTSQHAVLFWVAIEGTTLATAPLISLRRDPRALEAAWKYLVVCSVGIALALLGTFFLALATSGDSPDASLRYTDLLARAATAEPTWLKASFLLLLVGYGTKMGLAPLHTWLPDAHSEAPSAASALLSGALLNLAFLGILRAQQALEAAGLGDFGRELLVGFGLFSIAVAAGFLLIQRDFKRLLAYSSVEHMGILALAVGIGKTAIYGGMLHAVNHSLTKGMLFLVAGNVYAAYGSKEIASVRGVQRALPVSGILWLAGFVLIAGVPPSGLFVSEFVVVRSALELGHPWIAALTLALLGAAFVGMASAFLTMGSNEPTRVARRREPLVSVLPPAALGAAVCVLGVFMPPPLERALLDAARALGGFGG